MFVVHTTDTSAVESPLGFGAGCLCEEMGLGKSVEVISAILSHTAPAATKCRTLAERIAAIPKADPNKVEVYSGGCKCVACDGCGANLDLDMIGAREHSLPNPFICAQCCASLTNQEVPGVAKATLIVCPQAIQAQWFAEIQRHTQPGALKVVTYKGQRNPSLSSMEGVLAIAVAHVQLPRTPRRGGNKHCWADFRLSSSSMLLTRKVRQLAVSQGKLQLMLNVVDPVNTSCRHPCDGGRAGRSRHRAHHL